MEYYLADILKHGFIKDNQLYQLSFNKLENIYKKEEFLIKSTKRKQKVIKNDDSWSFLDLVRSNFKIEKAVLFSFNSHEYEHNTQDDFITVEGVSWGNAKISTGNVVGVVKYSNNELNIGSRFGNYFLEYIIADADGFLEIKNFGGVSKENNLHWLLIYIWKTKLKKAFRLGMPKAYTSKTDTLLRPKGKLNALDYFLNKKTGKYLSTYREHSYLTDAAILINETFKEQKVKDFISDINPIVQSFKTVAEGNRLSRRDLQKVEDFKNPFYSDYNEVIALSKKIIFNQGLSFGDQENSSAFLFDVSMLFEYFIKKLLIRNGLNILSKFTEAIKVPTGVTERELQPDILIEDDDGLFVFDVKYKRFDNIYGVKREDVFQLHTYVGQFSNHKNIKGCGFIFPTNGNNRVIKKEIQVMSVKISFYVFLVGVPKELDKNTFFKMFNFNCKKFVEEFKKIKT